jgi:hypothetical protein
MKAILSPLALALALTAPCAYAAEDIYRSTMPDGSIRYGESPDPKAKAVKKVPAGPSQTGVMVVRPGEKTPAEPAGGGVAVLPPPPQQPNTLTGTGTLTTNPNSMPKRGY